MLYHLFTYLDSQWDLPGSGLFYYLTFRAGLAILLSLIITIVFGHYVIRFLQRLQVGEQIRSLGLNGQEQKQGTPTMGGLLIFLAIVIPSLLLADLSNIYIQLLLLSTAWLATIGFIDDYIKVFKKDKRGLSGKFKVLGQVGLGIIVAFTMLLHEDIVVRMNAEEANERGLMISETIPSSMETGNMSDEYVYVQTTLTNVPFFKNNLIDYKDVLFFLGENAEVWAWVVFVPLVIFIVTAVSNGANLTDGLDGLAAGVSAVIVAALAILSYVSGNTIIAEYLNILYLPYTGEIVVFSASFLGACIGYLWYNAYPAKVFMGDTGSLMLGGLIAALAILIRKELLIPILCGIFLVENLSVILQVGYFKYTRRTQGEGKRIWLMTPIHHHFQKKGVHESVIVVRFWIIAILLAVITIITLKIR
ncbi:MAG: phospho-N-acetylmuramoyl-pentapeptide-transferase [Bacteroidetes bacterium]|jgi:phospho-N-acetylmuramoyl-pentapeptide-transferase|nr:phospho-N-acetylmuramoyl-pentapeptide-transferase [Bacteroidota bacterium]